MPDVNLHISIGVKNDGITAEAGLPAISLMLQEVIEERVLSIPWVTDMLVTKGQSGEES